MDGFHLSQLIHFCGGDISQHVDWMLPATRHLCLQMQEFLLTCFKIQLNKSHFNLSTQYGCYEPNCGLDNVLMSWGHDGRFWRPLWHFLERRKIGWSVWYLDQIQVGGGTGTDWFYCTLNVSDLCESFSYLAKSMGTFVSRYPRISLSVPS